MVMFHDAIENRQVTTQAYSGDGLLPSSELEERSLVGAQSTAERGEPFDMSQIQGQKGVQIRARES